MAAKYQIGSTVFENWQITRKIGSGSFGTVYEIQRQDFGQTYHAALKVITVPQDSQELQSLATEGMTRKETEDYLYTLVEDIVNEFALMSHLKATNNVVSYEDHQVIKHENGIGWDILIRMELLHPLLEYAYQHPFSRRDVIKLGIDMCNALELCQKYNIIHRDIKPDNIFVSDNGDFKLGDFGIARTIEKTMSGLSKKGTYSYMAPEVYLGREYGFSVDVYSLGIVLYRLLNRNRTPFLPEPPEPITYSNRDKALGMRMSGETIPAPFYASGRLSEIILKACAYQPKDRYSSPAMMRQELEAILYDVQESEIIYPEGDFLEINKEDYFTGPDLKADIESLADETEGIWGENTTENKTVGIWGKQNPDESDRVKDKVKNKEIRKAKTGSKAGGKSKIIIVAVSLVIIVAIGSLCLWLNETNKLKRYQNDMEQASEMIMQDPKSAMELFLDAQSVYPRRPEAYISYAYALYVDGQYDECVSYIEDDLLIGKEYEQSVQDELREIVGAAYFELEDYAAAAANFRMRAAGESKTITAMRDYAVSLGRLGNINEAKQVLQEMYAAGADNEVTDYVQAEVDYALKDYQAAEQGFSAILNNTNDATLQRRALRSLAELYRDCAVLARSGNSPIRLPASKAVDLLNEGIAKFGLQYDNVLWEMLAMAYYEAYHTDSGVGTDYLTHAAECFNRVIDAGIQKDYLYSNLYSIYYELHDYAAAENSLQHYESAFPQSYMPHALRGLMLITIENQKKQDARDYKKALAEYKNAGALITSNDDATYYQQLESLIKQLRSQGWL